MGGTASKLTLSGSSIMFENCVFDATGVDDIAFPMSIQASDAIIRNCTFLLATASARPIAASR